MKMSKVRWEDLPVNQMESCALPTALSLLSPIIPLIKIDSSLEASLKKSMVRITT
jgi:hypothetical protein